MTQEIYWELLAWLFRSFLAVTTFAFVVAGYQALRCRPRDGSIRDETPSWKGVSSCFRKLWAIGTFVVL